MLIDGVDLRDADPAGGARAHRHRAAGRHDLCGQRARQHRLSAGRAPPTPRSRRRRGPRCADEFIRKLAKGYDTRARRARRHAVGRPAPAHRDRPRHPARCADPAARRGDLGARRRERDAGADGARTADAGPHDASSSPTGWRPCSRPTASSSWMRAASSRKARTKASCAKGGIYARLAKLQFETGASAFRGAAE